MLSDTVPYSKDVDTYPVGTVIPSVLIDKPSRHTVTAQYTVQTGSAGTADIATSTGTTTGSGTTTGAGTTGRASLGASRSAAWSCSTRSPRGTSSS